MPINRDEVKNTLFGGIKKSQTLEVQKQPTPKENKFASSELPKWKTFEKVTVLLSSKQKDAIDELSKKLMRYRSQKGSMPESRERITANSIFRSIVDIFIEKSDALDMTAVQNEEELMVWIRQVFK
jgi:hypothetical protein